MKDWGNFGNRILKVSSGKSIYRIIFNIFLVGFWNPIFFKHVFMSFFRNMRFGCCQTFNQKVLEWSVLKVCHCVENLKWFYRKYKWGKKLLKWGKKLVKVGWRQYGRYGGNEIKYDVLIYVLTWDLVLEKFFTPLGG